MTVNDVTPEQMMPRREFLKRAALAGGSALAMTRLGSLVAKAEPVAQKPAKTAPLEPGKVDYNAAAAIVARMFPNLATVEGISQKQLQEHLGLYNGYVKKINEIDQQIKAITPDLETLNATYAPYRELHVEQTYALNGVVLHEYYFENIGGPRSQPGALLKEVVSREFGSWDNYTRHLLGVGKSMRGWAVTAYNLRDHRIHNYGLDLHNQGVPVYVMPLLVLDVYEHAYMIDFGTKRAAYLDAFLRNVDWQVVEDRLRTMMLHYQPHGA